MAKERFDMTKNYGYNYLIQAASCYSAARTFELRISLDEKDKIIDELLIRRLRKMADDLFNQGLNNLTVNNELSEEEKVKLMQATVGSLIK